MLGFSVSQNLLFGRHVFHYWTSTAFTTLYFHNSVVNFVWTSTGTLVRSCGVWWNNYLFEILLHEFLGRKQITLRAVGANNTNVPPTNSASHGSGTRLTLSVPKGWWAVQPLHREHALCCAAGRSVSVGCAARRGRGVIWSRLKIWILPLSEIELIIHEAVRLVNLGRLPIPRGVTF